MFADVVFPQKLPPLTYRVPPDAPADLPGRIVQAELGRRIAAGIVVSTFADSAALAAAHGPLPDGVHLKTLSQIDSQFFTTGGFRLFQWLTDYYLAPAGLALKACFFDEATSDPKPLRKSRKPSGPLSIATPEQPDPSEQESIQVFAAALRKQTYQTWLYHAPAAGGPQPFVSALLHSIIPDTKGIILLVPEFGMLQQYAGWLSALAGDRLAMLHSRLTPNQRIHAIHRIRSGMADIVLGTRSAVLAPMPKLSLIIAADEQSPAYKAEEGVRYQGRDVAVMRGYLERAAVLLASACPSLESSYNVRIGKYRLLDHHMAYRATAGRPEIRMVRPPSRTERTRKLLAPDIVKAVRAYLKSGRSVLFLINRKGYSLLECRDCAAMVHCPACSAPLVFHKNRNFLECRTCMTRTSVPSQCPSCSGVDLQPFGAGTERIREELAELFGQEAAIVEKDHEAEADGQVFSELAPLVVGTEYAVHSACERDYSAAVVLSLDATLSQPDFRAHERTFQEITLLLRRIRPGGTLFIQTRNERSPLVRAIARLDYDGFLSLELQQRRAVGYPPFARLITIAVYATQQAASAEQRLSALLGKKAPAAVEVLGPLEVVPDLKGYTRCWRIMIKSSDRKTAGSVARRIQQLFEKDKHVRVVVDVDPYVM